MGRSYDFIKLHIIGDAAQTIILILLSMTVPFTISLVIILMGGLLYLVSQRLLSASVKSFVVGNALPEGIVGTLAEQVETIDYC